MAIAFEELFAMAIHDLVCRIANLQRVEITDIEAVCNFFIDTAATEIYTLCIVGSVTFL